MVNQFPKNPLTLAMSCTNDPTGLIASDLTKVVIGGFFDVYNHMGRGFLESVYEGSLELVLEAAGVKVQRQYPIPVFFRGKEVGFFRC
jgi:GxxExxY protein